MKKLLLFFLFLAVLPGYGQNSQVVGEPTISDELRAALSTLDRSRMTTDVLLNQTIPISNPHNFGGNYADTAVNNFDNWQQQYWEYFNGSFNRASLEDLTNIRTRIGTKLKAGQVPLLLLEYRYDELLADAPAQGLVRIDSANAHMYDGPNRSRSPYATGRLFSAALARENVAGSTTIYVGNDFWLGNTPPPAYLYIDFGDGAGYRYVQMNTTVQLAGTGAQQRTVLVYHPPTAVAASAYAKTTLSVSSTTANAARRPIALAPDAALGVRASSGWPGSDQAVPTAIAWIKYAPGNTSGKFRKPLVFVEGIDFAKTMGAYPYEGVCPNKPIAQTGYLDLNYFSGNQCVTDNYRNGEAGWNEMVEYNAEYPSLERLPELRARLQNQEGYDILFLDFTDGADKIQNNALTLVELLKWLNDPSRREGNVENVVMGASMGGQVVRFALSYMEKEGNPCHNTKLYISVDSPHRGANAPLGIQYMLKHLKGNFAVGGKFEKNYQSLLRPASRQMLIYHAEEDSRPLREEWQNWQKRADSWPMLMRKVAVANGNGNAVSQENMTPGMLLLKTNDAFPYAGGFPYWGVNYAYALPGTSSGGKNNVVFRHKNWFSLFGKWNYNQAPSNAISYDNAPGGNRPNERTFVKQGGIFIKRGTTESDTFIPTISSLGINDAGDIYSANANYNVRANIIDNERPGPKYAFDAYFTPQRRNEAHIRITNGQPSNAYSNEGPPYNDNSSWIVNELKESEHRVPASLTSSSLNYNFGSLYRRLLPSVYVSNGGRLYVNNAGLPVSGGTPATQANPVEANFEMYTSNCGTLVQLWPDGQLVLGQPNSPQKATVRFANKSVLDMRWAGQTIVNAGSTLVI